MAYEISARISARTVKEFDQLVAPIEAAHPGSGRNLKWTLMSLADYADPGGFAWPSVKSIEHFTGLSTRSVQRALKQAQVLNLMRVRKRTDASSQYLFNLDALPYVERERAPKQRGPHQEYEKWEEPDLFEPEGTGATDDTTRCHGGTPLVPPATLPGATVAPKPIIEPVKEPVIEPSVAIATVDGNSVFDRLVGEAEEIFTADLRAFLKTEWDALKADFPNLGHARAITPQMLALARERAKEFVDVGKTPQKVFAVAFEEIRKSRFLTGQAPPGPGRTSRFRLTPSYLMKPHIFREVMNGKYADTAADDGSFDPSTGEVLGPAAAATRGTVHRFRQARQQPAVG